MGMNVDAVLVLLSIAVMAVRHERTSRRRERNAFELGRDAERLLFTRALVERG